MAGLRAAAQAIGLDSVSTFIQSGNLIFESTIDASQISTALRAVIKEQFGFDVPVILRTREAFAAIGQAHPFESEEEDDRFLVVAFLDRSIPDSNADRLPVDGFAPDRFLLSGSEIYIHYPSGTARSKLTADVIDRRLGVTSTMRNWRTIRRLVELSSA